MATNFNIIWTNKALKQLEKLPRPIARRIFEKVNLLCQNPFAQDVHKLVAQPFFRLRIGDYRIIFNLNTEQMRIEVVLVGHRKNIYG